MKHKITLLACLFLSITFFAQKTIEASDIMKNIKAGKSIIYNNATIVGTLDFTFMDEALEKLPSKRKSWWGNGNSSNEVKKLIEVKISFTNCTFKDDVLAYIPDEDSGYTFTANFEDIAVFKNSNFERKAMFKYSRFERDSDFSGSTFNDDSTFKYAKFDKNISFKNTKFSEISTFKYAKFSRNVSFANSVFEDEAVFKYTKFNDGVSFNQLDVALWTELNKITIGCTDTAGSGAMYLSAILLTDESTLNWLFVQSKATAFGAFNEWTGAVGDISDGSDVTYLVGDASGQRFVVDTAVDDILQTGYNVVGNVLSVRASKVGNGSSTLKAIDYTNSNIYKSSGQNVVSSNVDVLQFISYVNPDTSLAWTEQTLENTQFGLELT